MEWATKLESSSSLISVWIVIWLSDDFGFKINDLYFKFLFEEYTGAVARWPALWLAKKAKRKPVVEHPLYFV